MTGEHQEQSENRESRRYDALAAAAWIPEMVDRIVDQFDPAKIILFGSHARGDAHRWSDIDLLVVFDEPVDNRQTTVEILRLLNDYLVAVDVVVTDTSRLAERMNEIATVYRPAVREGKVVYER
jgi:uncharacterized protein